MSEAVGADTTLLRQLEQTREELEQARRELRELNKIGMALMSERDPERLLGIILTQARALTASDAGSLYLVEEGEGWERLPPLPPRSERHTSPPRLPRSQASARRHELGRARGADRQAVGYRGRL